MPSQTQGAHTCDSMHDVDASWQLHGDRALDNGEPTSYNRDQSTLNRLSWILLVTVASIATLVAVVIVPLILVPILLLSGAAAVWWSVGQLRRGPRRFVGGLAACFGVALIVASLAVAVAFAPISGPKPTHSAPQPATPVASATPN